MRQEFFQIIEEFLKLNEKGYVESISKEKNSCGLTLEHLLGKEPDSMFFPDYNGVELKTTTRFSGYNINLKLNQKVLVNGKYYFELKIDYNDKKIFIKTYDINMNFI